MRGWRVPLRAPATAGVESDSESPLVDGTPVHTHYAIFSSQGPWGRGQLDQENLVVFVHGLASQLDQLTWGDNGGLVQELVNQGMCVLAFDLLGHGYTDTPGHVGVEAVVGQLEALLEHLRVSRPVSLLGFSVGNLFAAMYAAAHPGSVRRILFLSPFRGSLPGGACPPVAFLYTCGIQLVFEGNLSYFRTIYDLILDMDESLWGPALPVLRRAGIPVLVLHGLDESDPLMMVPETSKMIHEAIPGSTLRAMTDVSHMTWATGPAEPERRVRDQVICFLRHGVPLPAP